MPEIHYLKGDATKPIKSPAVITHICNTVGKWGKGFVLALTDRFGKGPDSPEYTFRNLQKPWQLGTLTFCHPEQDISVVNMIAQKGIYPVDGIPPIRYEALSQCLFVMYDYIIVVKRYKGATVHMPRIGCGLAGGTWDKIQPLIEQTMTVDTYVYDWEK